MPLNISCQLKTKAGLFATSLCLPPSALIPFPTPRRLTRDYGTLRLHQQSPFPRAERNSRADPDFLSPDFVSAAIQSLVPTPRLLNPFPGTPDCSGISVATPDKLLLNVFRT